MLGEERRGASYGVAITHCSGERWWAQNDHLSENKRRAKIERFNSTSFVCALKLQVCWATVQVCWSLCCFCCFVSSFHRSFISRISHG